jgi:hypothetical protein
MLTPSIYPLESVKTPKINESGGDGWCFGVERFRSLDRASTRVGRQRYPTARELTITADCGGSNGARLRLWKLELQKFADEIGLTIKVRHYPPGTSKWNKIEHRLFCHITQTGAPDPSPIASPWSS